MLDLTGASVVLSDTATTFVGLLPVIFDFKNVDTWLKTQSEDIVR